VETAGASKQGPSFRIKVAGVFARPVVILLIAVLTARVASPQVEKLSSVFETPGDLIRVLLGFAVVVWCVINVFILPKDAEAYRNWLWLGLAIVPLSVLCAFVVW
jgi:hypothetical protein